MNELAAYLSCLILVTLSLFQIALICGAPMGRFAWGGSHKVLPMKLRAGSVIAILLYGIFAVFILSKAELIPLVFNSGVVSVGMWIITAYFVLGIFMNGISRSKPERIVMTPVAIVLAVLFFIVAMN